MDEQQKQAANTNDRNGALDDDASLISKGSADAALKTILKCDIDPVDDNMVIDFTGNENELDALVEPLDDIVAETSTKVVSQQETKSAAAASPAAKQQHEWQKVFSTEEELARHQQIASSLSHDSTVSSEQTIVSLDDNEISSLLKGELLEPQVVRPVTPNDGPGHNGDIIHRVMACLHHLERDGQIISRANDIVRECQFYHGQGDKRYQNLPRCIFDRLVQLLGGSKFNEIYRRAHYYTDPRSYHPPPPPPPHHRDPHPVAARGTQQGPSNMELAIAYGIHIARSSNRSEPPIQLVQHGVAALNSMTPKERVMFWNYMTKRGTS